MALWRARIRQLVVAFGLAASVCPGQNASAQATDTLVAVDGSPLATFEDARALAVDPAGLLYVVDAGTNAVQILTPDGVVLRTLGGPGYRQGQFDEPSDVDPTNGQVILVADAGNARVQRFSDEFLHLGSLPVGTGFQEEQGGTLRAPIGNRDRAMEADDGHPVAVAMGQGGETHVIDAARGAMLTWDASLRPLRRMDRAGSGGGPFVEPTSLAVDDQGALYVGDKGREAVLVFDHFGNYVRALGEGLLRDIRSVSATEDRIWVVLPRQLVEYDLNGRLLRRLDVDLNGELVDAEATSKGLYLLTSKQLRIVPADQR